MAEGLAKQLESNYLYFIEQWAAVYRRNVQANLPQLNWLSFILRAFPAQSELLQSTATEMIQESYKREAVDAFMKAYRWCCAEVHQYHLMREMEVIEGAIRCREALVRWSANRKVGVQKEQPGNSVPRKGQASRTSSEQRIQEIFNKRKAATIERKAKRAPKRTITPLSDIL
jgi:hypothetical protein